MHFRTVLLLGTLATAATACTVQTIPPGTVLADGSVDLGFELFDNKGKPDREAIPLGRQLGALSTIRLVANKPIALSRMTVIFADGERFVAPLPARLRGGESTPVIQLPRGPREIHSVVIVARSEGKELLAKLELYGTR